MNYSNPRLKAVIEDWPYGRLRTTVTFEIKCGRGGERATKTTINPKTGRVNKPKKTTYAARARIVTGDDDRLYIAELTRYGRISIRSSDMIHDVEGIHEDDPRYSELLELFK